LALVFAVPEFSAFTVPAGAAPPASDVKVTVTLAVLVNPLNRPNTNPAMAMAAMSVIAMRMTVARIGEIAFLFRTLMIFIVWPALSHDAGEWDLSAVREC